jgi:hypothetical protein
MSLEVILMKESKLTIRCRKDVEKSFKLLCIEKEKNYGDLLMELLDYYYKENNDNKGMAK